MASRVHKSLWFLVDALWPMGALLIVGVGVSTQHPSKSTIAATDWQWWMAVLTALFAGTLIARVELSQWARSWAVFFCGFLCARLIFW